MEDIWKRVRRVLHVDLREDLPGRSRSTCRMIFLRHVESSLDLDLHGTVLTNLDLDLLL